MSNIIVNGGMSGKLKLSKECFNKLVTITDYPTFMTECKPYKDSFIKININTRDSIKFNIAKNRGKKLIIEWTKKGMMHHGDIVIK